MQESLTCVCVCTGVCGLCRNLLLIENARRRVAIGVGKYICHLPNQDSVESLIYVNRDCFEVVIGFSDSTALKIE